jgi:PAS domain S-box-containing protein
VKLRKASSSSDLKPLRVLIVEDSENDALLLLRELRRGGYEPIHERVETPEEMEEALSNSEWDVIVSDYRLPRFGAPEALSMFRESGLEAPFVVVSGKVGEDAAVEAMKAGAHDYVMKGSLARLCATVERGLEEAEERRRLRRAEAELRRRDAILEALGFAAERFLGEAASWEESIEAVLERLGVATGASRVYIFENFVGEEGELWNVQRHEWVAPMATPGASEGAGGSAEAGLPYGAAGYGRWMEILGRGETIHGHTREFPEDEQWALLKQDIVSIAVVPIFVEEEWWGFLGFDECFVEREWSAAELDVLKAAASTLGAALRRRRIEEDLKQSEERYRAVIEQATDGIFLLDAQTRRVLESNSSYQKMLGYSADELRGMQVYDFVAHPRENVDATIQRTLEQRRRVVGNRAYRRKDGTLIDVEIGVSVIDYGGRDVICTIVRDVTERKRAEEALARSEDRLRTIIETEPECVKVLGMDGSLLEMNPAGLSMIEADSLEQVRGKSVYSYIAPEHRRAFVALTERVLRGGSGTLEFELVGLKGTRRWLDTNAVPLRDAGGEIIGLLAITRDITERKRAEERLRASEAELRALFEAMTDVILMVDGEGRCLKIAPTNSSLLYRPPAELLGRTLHEIFPEEQADAFLERIRQALGARRTVTFEYDLPISGQQMWFEATISPMLEDSVVVVARDVTDRRKNEEALRQSERLYRTVIEQASENIFLVDVETRRIVESNPTSQATLGYTEEELRRMTLYDIVAHDRKSVDHNIRRTLKKGRSFVGQRKYRRKDGSLMEVEASGSIILRGDRETLCVVAHDVTERARAQELLEERVATLSRIAASLTFDLPAEDTLNGLAKSAVSASTAVACGVVLVDNRDETLHLFGSYGLPEGYTAGLQAAYRAGAPSPSLRAFRTRQPVLVRDLRRFLLAEPLYAPIHQFVGEVPWDIVYSLPLASRDRTVGTIFLCYLPDEEPGEGEKAFLRAVADQTAVALENARLFSEARGKAALEERQRLARELHDSVSQALYGIALGAKTARTLVDQNPQRAADPLDYVLSLAEAGLAEMRALIFELRPESLETEGLVVALEKQAAALRARHEVGVQTHLCEEPEASPETKEALYRIAQEALHNTVKHARARNAQIRVECDPDTIILEISDDGVGFDTGGDFPGHLGLRSMRERAEGLGGTLKVESAPGEGTRIRALIPVR